VPDISAWGAPVELGYPDFSIPETTPPPPDTSTSLRGAAGAEATPRHTEPTPRTETFSPDMMRILGGVLADQNPNLGPLMGLLGGEKPDIMSLLPLLMQVMNTKKPAAAETPADTAPASSKTVNLARYMQ